MRFSILILAAGSSSRLGQPKQLVEFQGETLIRRITRTALSISDDVLIVLGANADLVEQNLCPFSAQINTIFNPNWQQGMGTSISLGTKQLAPNTDVIIILLCDQPFVNTEKIQEMLQMFASFQPPIIACQYKNQLGVPMLFDKMVFPELLNLQGDKGAKAFLHKYTDKIGIVDFQEGNFDIDTLEDLNKLSAF
ncbi:nucleotidyltransferase family protein [Arcicella sp. LKC2W]|uniref:nucleotidyltransferase family protein n=1 Tax=Arcicella sp. LKC2W TaxID=2984198 RepID=UPI002B1FBC39|nr:nucleotidyltransferase family protein [Arcicella sp. LKC2W]MEA5461891.1 nucleotidyltransferase family protein [Arcicella sp. LKC2W]